MISFISLKCPRCDADLSIEEGRETAYCSYCGMKILINDENKKQFTYHHIDEAEIRQAETDRMVKMRQLDILEKDKKRGRGFIIAWALAIVILLIVGIAGFNSDNPGMSFCLLFAILVGAFGFIFWDEKTKKDIEKTALMSGRIKIGKALADFKNKDYKAVETEYAAAGFSNIRTINLGDLTTGLIKKPGRVATVAIAGVDEIKEGEWVMPTAEVTISYHGFSDR